MGFWQKVKEKQAEESKKGGAMTTCGALGVAFVVLKLCGVIGWSWWLVLLPFYLKISVWLAISAALLFFAGVLGLIEHLAERDKP